jgi:hypothetical protein
MAITTLSFAKDPRWNAPGPEFPISAFSIPYRYQWAKSVTPGTSSTLAPAVPSWTGRPPEAEYWKSQVTKLEWSAVVDVWQHVARTIQLNDPFFRPFREPWYVTREGVWTEQFRQHPTFSLMAEELAIRMEEELGSVERLLRRIESGPTPPITHPQGESAVATVLVSSSDDDPVMNAPDESALAPAAAWWPSWKQVADFGYRGFKVGRMLTPEGVGWLVVDKALTYGYHKYREHQAHERAKQRAERRHSRGLDVWQDLPFGAWTPDDEIRGFEQSGWELPLWGVRAANATDYDWTALMGAPKVLASQDGSFL